MDMLENLITACKFCSNLSWHAKTESDPSLSMQMAHPQALAFGVGASPDECQETDHYDFVASHQL